MIAPWVLVNAGFHETGGQSKANAGLADYLLERGHVVHLVAHDIDLRYQNRDDVVLHRVPRPLNADVLGCLTLNRAGRKVAARVTAEHPGARVVVNGGCCRWGDVNWVHCVHHAWDCFDRDAPLWFRVKNRAFKAWARRWERRSIAEASVVIANSERTRRQLIEHLGTPTERIKVVYLGTNSAWSPATAEERMAERRRLGLADDVPVVFFVGALSHDVNKGFDTLFEAWSRLTRAGGWDAYLVVIGGGSGVARWKQRAQQTGLGQRIQFAGFTDRVVEMLAAADLLVSPSRYDAYGLNVPEAICRGVPALASGRAGVAEQYPPELADMVLPNPEDADYLASRLKTWRASIDLWRARFEPLRLKLRGQTWTSMAERIVRLVETPGVFASGPAAIVEHTPENSPRP